MSFLSVLSNGITGVFGVDLLVNGILLRSFPRLSTTNLVIPAFFHILSYSSFIIILCYYLEFTTLWKRDLMS